MLVATGESGAPAKLNRSIDVDLAGPQASFTFRYPETWTVFPDRYKDSILLLNVHELKNPEAPSAAKLLISTERRLSENDAIERLRDLASDANREVRYLVIGGWPAVRYSTVTPLEKVGEEDRRAGRRPMVERDYVAIAAGSTVILIKGTINEGAPESLREEIFAMGESLVMNHPGNPAVAKQRVEELGSAPPPTPTYRPRQELEEWNGVEKSTPLLETEQADAGLVRDLGNFSEIEVVVSPDGQNIIVATNGRRYSVSNDGGQNFTQDQIDTGVDIVYAANGDPSLGYGQSGDFYFGFIAYPDGTGGVGNTVQGCTTGVTGSTDDGQNFSHRGHATICPYSGAGVCFPDQPHITADRWNPSASSGDQVYSTWRNFTPSSGSPNCDAIGSGSVQSRLVCSTDSGQNWSGPVAIEGDYPRITVGQDGFVYVVSRSFSGGNIRLAKFTSCANGLNQVSGFPVTVASSVTAVSCPVPGLDRCNDGNDLRSHMVAVDDVDASHIFVSYATNTATGNEDVVIEDSTDGGASWSSPTVLNSGFAARRYMPWVCAVGGTAYVSWYDRRNKTEIDNSLTDYYGASATRESGSLQAGSEFRISPTSDSNCASGWPCAPRSSNDSESCSVQPQLAGVCQGSGARCDFSDGCGDGTTCQTGGGCPKYGDYSGIACGAGRLYAAYASATPPGGPQSTDIDSFLLNTLVCCVPQIQVPGSLDFPAVCGSDQVTATLQVCNTGEENLEVDSIDSSDPDFAITDPSSGWPVEISPDFCFPFQATFTGSGSGTATTVFTVNNNDPVNPAVAVDATAEVGEEDIRLVMADNGNFGNVCLGEFKDLELTIQNSGSCDLTVDSISSSDSDFVVGEVDSYPLVIAPGDSVGVPIRYEPSALGADSADITVSSSDPDSPSTVQVSGTAPPGDINVSIANSGDFGQVCKGGHADLDLHLLNQGECDLTITSIAFDPDPGSFELPVDLTFPLVLSHDADFTVPVRFAPTQCSDTPETRTLRIVSDDPDENPVDVTVTGVSPCPNLVIDPPALSGLFAFPPTVADPSGTLGCFSERQLVLRNNATCPLTISSIAAVGVSGDPLDFAVTSPTVFPIILPGGEETLNVVVRFKPQADADPLAPSEVTGLLTVISDDPDAPHTAPTCGESAAQSGMRILVTEISSGVPIPVDEVDQIRITSKGLHQPYTVNLMFDDQPLSEATVCGNDVFWHVDQETLPSTETAGSDPNSKYITKAKEGNLQTTEEFPLGQCEMRVFQLQLRDAGSEECLLLLKGDPCETDGECCSGKCRGPEGGKTCK